MSTISRRAFLKTVGVGALSVAAMSVLAGCDNLPTGTTEEVVTGSIEAKFGQNYILNNSYGVNLTEPAALDTGAKEWKSDYVTAYRTLFGSKAAYDDATDTEKDNVSASAVATADKEATFGNWVVTAAFKIQNYTENDVLLASGAAVNQATSVTSSTKTNTSVFSATCDGKDLVCVSSAVVLPGKAVDGDVKCFIAAPANFEELTLKVTLGGKTVVYTIKNGKYVNVKKVDVTAADSTGADPEIEAWAD